MTAPETSRPRPRHHSVARARLGRALELAIELLIRACGISAVVFVFGIFFFVIREGWPFLVGDLNLGEFFGSTQW